ncbi:MAG TPA: hypothetical protein VFA85_14660 [Terriglobales bacterium]|nr:hypothetical protein [Terriglobales bacterium]
MEKTPFGLLPEKAVSGFKTYFPYAGKYYGYLSGFLHWRKETHIRALNFDEEYVAVVYASGQNKWEAVANVILMTSHVRRGLHKKVHRTEMQAGRKELPTPYPGTLRKAH